MQSASIQADPLKPVRLSPIVVPKTSDVLASELRRQILSGVLPPGTALPAERDLVAQTGLSRGSVRDALRILEAESLIITRPGRYGGSVANKPDDESLKRSISSFVHGRGITLLSLLQTREAIEPSLAALAARHRTADELQRLVDVTERVENAFLTPPQFLRENVEWHMAIASASHNELLRAFLHSISGMVYKASSIENFANDEVRSQVMYAHRRILEAIVAQDAALAERRMGLHLHALTEACRAFPHAPLVLTF